MKHRSPCGCTHDGARWLSECAAHKAENDALHARAMADHNPRRQAPVIPDASAVIPDLAGRSVIPDYRRLRSAGAVIPDDP